MNLLADLVRSPVRAELLRIFFGIDPRRLYRAQLISSLPFAKESIETQLNALRRMKLVTAEKDGNRTYYSADTSHPLYVDLRSVVLKTAGLHDVLANALDDAAIEFAFVFGSLASKTEKPESDVDLLVVGTITEFHLAKRLRGVGEQLGREINPHVFTREEINRRVESNDHFMQSVLSKPKFFVTGNEHDFARLAQRGMDTSASNES